jgi:type III pantothenate kinase
VKLLIDIGNTRIKWAFDDGSGLVSAGETVHRGKPEVGAVDFVAALKLVPESACAVNVAGAAVEVAIANKLKACFDIELDLVRTAEHFGDVVNGYSTAGQLGADRWAAIVGGWQLYRRSVCVVDAGTAVTIDAVAQDGRHNGGIIVPGLALMHASLNNDTSDIVGFVKQSEGPLADDEWFGTDTRSAVERGAVFMLSAAINGAVAEISKTGDMPVIILTGGDAEIIGPLIAHPVEYRPLLVLEGLRHLATGPINA